MVKGEGRGEDKKGRERWRKGREQNGVEIKNKGKRVGDADSLMD